MDATVAKAPANPYGPSPLRRPASIRRTSTLDTEWPEGANKAIRMRGRARDLFTPADSVDAKVLAEDEVEFVADPSRLITAIRASRRNEALQQLVGARGGGHLRKEIARVAPDELAQATPLHLLLDDFSGASLVGGWAWSQWDPRWVEQMREAKATAMMNGPGGPGRNGQMEGVCTGFRPGSSALGGGEPAFQSIPTGAVVPSLLNPEDPLGWHPLGVQEGVGMRRARRIDVWFDDLVRIDVGFQDSATAPTSGDRVAVHEYQVTASADPETFELLSVEVDPRVLPYGECLGAAPNAVRMQGAGLRGFRLGVPETLPGILGCTHLNDVLRSMADIPHLARRLEQELGPV